MLQSKHAQSCLVSHWCFTRFSSTFETRLLFCTAMIEFKQLTKQVQNLVLETECWWLFIASLNVSSILWDMHLIMSIFELMCAWNVKSHHLFYLCWHLVRHQQKQLLCCIFHPWLKLQNQHCSKNSISVSMRRLNQPHHTARPNAEDTGERRALSSWHGKAKVFIFFSNSLINCFFLRFL